MKATVVAVTSDVNEKEMNDYLRENKIFSGKMAGICYQKDKYFDSSVSDSEKAEKRFGVVAPTGHHSIADHSFVTILFEDISKMLAMVLNSCNFYNTSEKSGRYTEMKGNSEEERNLYEKWKKLFHKRVLEIYPDYDDLVLNKKISKEMNAKVNIKCGEDINNEYTCMVKDLEENDFSLPSWKIAQENARYILSVFTRSTTMAYTTSIRQWNYIYDWTLDAIERCEKKENKFYDELAYDLTFLRDIIKEYVYVEELRDNKNRRFDFLIDLYYDKSPLRKYNSLENHYGLTYSTTYPSSFVSLAQAQRHRTLHYYMDFNPKETLYFYIPPMIKGSKLEAMWLSDLCKVYNYYPQATLVQVIEIGMLSDFVLKCKERLCGRAQLEIMEQTIATANKFRRNVESYYIVEREYLDELFDDSELKPKCKLLGGCKEPCTWGSSCALSRRV